MYENRKGETGMMKRISVLGSTGSIGTQALDVIKNNSDRFRVAALSCARRIDMLREQIRLFRPDAVAVAEEADAATSLRNSAAWKYIMVLKGSELSRPWRTVIWF